MAAENRILEAKHISKKFGRRSILKDITFDLERGKMVGIGGENGSGKSTLLKILAGLLEPTSGEVVILQSIGFCPQEMSIFEDLTVRENFRYFASAYGLHKSPHNPSWEEVMDGLLRRFRFDRYRDTVGSHLSGGTKQKLNLSLALLHSPDLLILDEPYSGLDWETYVHFREYAEAMRSEGRSILVVSHFIYERSNFDAVYQLSEGVLQCA